MSKNKKKINNFPKYEGLLHDSLKDKEDAKLYLQCAFDDYERDADVGCLLLAIRDVVKAQDGMTELSQKTNLSRESLYKALSSTGNPQFSTVWAILNALGFHFVIESL